MYIHIPFCFSKCPYCDFYSFSAKDSLKSEYVKSVVDEINTLSRSGEYLSEFTADTLYLGGGTPSELNGEEIYSIIMSAKTAFKMPENSEITVECNPSSDIENLVSCFKKAGVNRVSLGMQSAVTQERKLLGRRSSNERITEVINLLKNNGISNISLDIMMGVPFGTLDNLKQTLRFAVNSDVTHISSYILKLEENTYYHKNRNKFTFPDEDAVCEMYEYCCDFLKENGFEHYEISNFAKPGYESRHNLKYWLLEDYLGIGAAAHSFIGGKRFYYSRSAEDFINKRPPIFDCIGGDCEEYIMLRLRLSGGISVKETSRLFGKDSVKNIIKKAPVFKERGLIDFDGDNVSLTAKGFLLSNSIISEFIV